MKRRGKSIPRRMVLDRQQSLSVVGSSAGSSGSSSNRSASTDAASLGGYVADDFELDLGVPTSSGYALVSDIDGIRSWINILDVNLAGFSAGVGGTVTESDSIRTGIQKLEYRVALDDAKVSFPGFGTTEGTACEGDDARLSDARTPLAHNQASTTISDSTEAGRAILTASDAAAQRSSLGLGSSATHESSEYAPASALTTKADLVNGLVPSSQLPSYVDDVLEFSNLAAFPVAGESGKIYVALDTNLAYRWSGSTYTEISPSIALGETAATAYRGDRGKDAYDHSQVTSGNPHGTTPAQIGAPSGSGTCSGNNTGDQTLSGLGGVPLTRKITSTIDLSADRNLTASDVGADASGSAAAVQANLSAHTSATGNPHSMPAATDSVSGYMTAADHTSLTADTAHAAAETGKPHGDAYAVPNASTTGSAGSVKAPTTTGLVQFSGMTAGTTRVKTISDANDTIAEWGAANTFSGTNTFTGSLVASATELTIPNLSERHGLDDNPLWAIAADKDQYYDAFKLNPPNLQEITATSDLSTWTSVPVSNSLFLGDKNLGSSLDYAQGTYGVRWTWNTIESRFLEYLIVKHSTDLQQAKILIEYSTDSGSTWTTVITSSTFTSWPGNSVIRTSSFGNPSCSVRITFYKLTDTRPFVIYQLKYLRVYPFGETSLFTWDENRKVSFVGAIEASNFTGSLSGSSTSVKAPTTTGLVQFSGMSAGNTRVKTVRDADDTIAEWGKDNAFAGMTSVNGGLQLKRTTVSNANSTGAATDVLVVQIGTMSAARTHTLPAASSLKAGQIIWFVDESGTVGATNTWTIQRAGADTIESSTSIVLNSAYARAGFMCDGSSKFTRITA